MTLPSRIFIVVFLLACRASPPPPSSIENRPEYHDAALIAQAWQLPVASTYHAHFTAQPNPTLCGPTSVENVVLSLGLPDVSAKAMVTTPFFSLLGIQLGGISLDRLAELMREKTQHKVTVLRDLSLAQFKDELHHVNDPQRRYSINFTREPLFGRGHGHHSPLGGYLENEDLVFVLDVNGDFQPFLVKSDRLFEAMNTLDGATKRGLLLIE